MQDLERCGEGARVSVVGRYQRWAPGPHPPDQKPDTARLILDDGTGVLIGRYGSPQCIRPRPELEHLDDMMVRVEGTFLRTLPWPGDGPPPGAWTGGGPQLVDIESGPVAVSGEPAEAVPEPTGGSTPPADERPPPAVAPAASSRAPLRPPAPGKVRRALVFGPSRWRVVALSIAAAVPALAVAIGGIVLSAPSWILIAAAGIAAGIFYGASSAVQRMLVGSELDRVCRLPIPLDVAAYLEWLDGDPRGRRPRVRLELASPAPADVQSDVPPRIAWDLRAEWRGASTLLLSGRKMVGQLGTPHSGTRTAFNTTGETTPVHRWFLQRVAPLAAHLHAQCGLREIAQDYEPW